MFLCVYFEVYRTKRDLLQTFRHQELKIINALMKQKSHFPNACPIKGSFLMKSQLSMFWKVAISCKAYEVDGICTVVFLISLRTESSIYTPAWM